jgi:hypothetical protein
MSATEHTAHGGLSGDTGEGATPVELAATLRELSDRIEALQADVRRLGGPGLPSGEPGWEGQEEPAAAAPSYAWVGSISAPVRRRPSVPRLFLEVLFLAGVAAAAAVAKLDAAVIAAVMAASWLLVALIEWAAVRAELRSQEIPAFAPRAPAEPLPADPSWFVAPVEHTLVEPAADSPTAVTRLPPAPDDLDATVERRPGD